MLFNMQHLAGIERIAAMPGFEDAGLETAQAVLEECARFNQDVVAPVNWESDKQPSSLKDGHVTTAPGFKQAYKQYSEGGAFSNRGWRARTLGPGRYFDPNNKVNNEFIDITGDMKIEANTEFRFDLIKLFSGAINIKGATFIDAGNIWLYNEDETRPGSKFDPAYFLNDIALSTGAGVRLDFSFFVFRVDLGFPVKKPYINENAGFDFKNMNFNDGVWNVIIGYPF